MTVGRKFLLIAIASLVPLAFSTGLWFDEIHGRVQKLQEERAGLLAHRELRRILGAMALQREQAVRAAIADKQLPAAFMASIRRMITETERVVTRAGKDDEATQLLAALRGNLEAVSRAVTEGNEADVWREYGDGMNRLVSLMAHVGSTSGIVVDNDPSTHFLARIAIERAPVLVSRLSDARSLVPMMVHEQKATPTQVQQLRAINVLAQDDLRAMGAYARDLVRVDPALAERANRPLPEVIGAGNGFLKSLETFARTATEGTKGSEWVYEQDESIPKILQAMDRLHIELTEVLDTRVNELIRRRNLLIALVVGVIGVTALFGFVLMRSVRESIHQALDVAHRVAGGDLGKVDEARGSDETARLLRSLGNMTKGLARMVGEVRASSETIGDDVRSLAAGNRDLSARTETQASAIEEAAASMEELTASVRQNRDAAKQTQNIAGLAGDATSRGIEAASRVVDNMDSIRESTKRVGEIVGMIDSIAFQTNILALNAAVEAARAGEHGRGFAVVAAEVRNLARRCADSAREIKGLVRGATEQVTDGARLVDEVSEAISTINTRVAEVGELMNRIVASSAEQATGIDQVGHTISQMEHVTQQNASLVEEIVAATESLSEQTARLGALVGAFRIEGPAPRARVAGPEAALALPGRR